MKNYDVAVGRWDDGITPVRERLREGCKVVNAGEQLTVSYDRSTDRMAVRRLIEEYGLTFDRWEEDKAIFVRPTGPDRWEYAFRLAGIDDRFSQNSKLLDVGSGRRPWPKATHICDVYDDFAQYARPGQQFNSASVTDGLPYENKQFEFATCFHVLEHVSDPVAAARELTRVARAGLVECPYPVKDGMILFQEQDHRWFVLPPAKHGGPLLFYPIDRSWWSKLSDPEAQGAAWRTYITNSDPTGDKAILRNYFSRVDPVLNVFHAWEGELRVQIIG